MTEWAGFWLAVAALFIVFGPANCGGSKSGTDSIATAIVKHLEAK